MNILSIETAGQTASLVIKTDKARYVQRRIEGVSEHARQLLCVLDALLQEVGIQVSELRGLVVNAGPGSFTGLRVGASVVKALAIGGNVPIYPIPSLAALAFAETPQEHRLILAALDARMGEVYAQYFFEGKALGNPVVTRPENLVLPDTKAKTLRLVGEVWLMPQYQDTLPKAARGAEISPLVLDAMMLMRYFETMSPAAETALAFEPHYVRDNIIQGAARG